MQAAADKAKAAASPQAGDDSDWVEQPARTYAVGNVKYPKGHASGNQGKQGQRPTITNDEQANPGFEVNEDYHTGDEVELMADSSPGKGLRYTVHKTTAKSVRLKDKQGLSPTKKDIRNDARAGWYKIAQVKKLEADDNAGGGSGGEEADEGDPNSAASGSGGEPDE